MNLNKRLAEYKEKQEAGEVPPITTAHLEVIYRGAEQLIASGQHKSVPEVGAKFPSFALPDEKGTIISSDEILKRGPLAIVFYRGIWCDYCNFELEALEEVYPRIKELGGELVAVSPVTMPGLRAAIRRNNLSFPLVSDRGSEYARRFNLVYTMSEEVIGVWGSFGLDFSQVNGDDGKSMTMPAVILSDQQGVIQFSEAHPAHWQRTEPDDLVAAFERLAS